MKISERTIKRLGEIITGDKGLSAYRSGPALCRFFNEIGTNHSYGQGFPSRWAFAEGCIREFNDTQGLRKVIQAAFDPRDYLGVEVVDAKTNERKLVKIQDAVNHLNEFLVFDDYEVVLHGQAYDVIDKRRGEV